MKLTMAVEDLARMVTDGATVFVGGFMGVGSPHRLLKALVARGARGLHVIANDTGKPGFGIGVLIDAGCVDRVTASHIGTNPVTQRQMFAGTLDVTLVPQGTLAERVRCGGAGLGGALTKTGIGTVAAEGRQTVEVGGQTWLVEPALRAQFALIASRSADYLGNLVYSMTARNFNPLMALAADTVVAEPNEIVPVGVLPPDSIHTPGVLVDYLVERPRLN